jgi:hypothetical protein
MRTELGLVCFRIKGVGRLTQNMLDILTERKKIFLVPATFRGQLIARFVIC